MNTKALIDERVIAGIRQLLSEAEAKGQKARIKRLRAMLEEVEASR